MRTWVERSLRNLGVDALDLVQLHCPPTALYYEPQVFADLDRLVTDGKIRRYGVSVEKVEEALKAIEFPGVVSVQIIFNIFRQRPIDLFFEQANDGMSQSSPESRSQAGCSPESFGRIANLTRPITVTSIARAKPSTSAKPSPDFLTRQASRR